MHEIILHPYRWHPLRLLPWEVFCTRTGGIHFVCCPEKYEIILHPYRWHSPRKCKPAHLQALVTASATKGAMSKNGDSVSGESPGVVRFVCYRRSQEQKRRLGECMTECCTRAGGIHFVCFREKHAIIFHSIQVAFTSQVQACAFPGGFRIVCCRGSHEQKVAFTSFEP